MSGFWPETRDEWTVLTALLLAVGLMAVACVALFGEWAERVGF